MRIALLVPSRERTEKKCELIDSLLRTTENIQNVTLYFGVDSDDPTREIVKKIAEDVSFVKIVTIPSTGGFQNLGVLWNICAKASTEEIISMIGDDMVFMTKGWDRIILDEFTHPNCPPDNFKMVYCYDGRHGPKIAVNAFVHRAYMDLTGYFMREEFPVDKIDIWLQTIFSSFDRLKYRGDMHIEHKHWSFRKSSVDRTVVRMRANNAEQISVDAWKKTLPDRIKEAEMISGKLRIPFNKKIISNSFING